MHISSSYAKILEETNFQPREFPLSGSKAKDREKKERTMVITMASYALHTPPKVAHGKPPGTKMYLTPYLIEVPDIFNFLVSKPALLI